MDEAAPKVQLFGTRGSAEAHAIRDFLYRCGVPFQWIELSSDDQARAEARVDELSDRRLPVCVFADGTRMECPTIRQITEKLGWFQNPSRSEYDLAIYGAGPAGLSAAVYGASEGLKTVVVERWAVGGQAASSPKIENYLGFPEGISGGELAERPASRLAASAPRSCCSGRASGVSSPLGKGSAIWPMAARSWRTPRSAPPASLTDD